MCGHIHASFLAIPSVVNFPKWVSSDGIDLATSDAFFKEKVSELFRDLIANGTSLNSIKIEDQLF